MEQIIFHFKNSLHKGTLFISREKKPFFYWCYFEDKELIDAVGECLGFTDKGGNVVPTENIGLDHMPIADEIKQHILRHYYQQWVVAS